MAFAAKFCAISGVQRLLWLPDWLRTTDGVSAKLCTSSCVKRLRWFPDWLCTSNGFSAKLCTCSGLKLLLWLPDWLPTTTGFCCETLHQFWCETFTVIARLTTYDYWLSLRNFAPVLVWNFYGDCLTDYLRLLDFAAKLCTSSGVKLLQWLPDWLPTTTGFCCETLHQFWSETFTVIAWLTPFDYWLLLQNFPPVLVWNFYGDCLTDNLRLLAFASKLCTSSGMKLLRWLPD